MLAACAAHYFAHSQNFSRFAETALALLAGTLSAMLVYWDRSSATSPLFFILGLIVLLPISGSLRAGVPQMATWRFALALTQAALLALMIGLTFRFALASLVQSVDLLSNSGLKIEYRVIVTSLLLVSPMAFLVLIPERPDYDGAGTSWEAGILARALRIGLNFVLVPVVLAYAGALHVYAFRLLIGGELPDGFIAWQFILFVGLGSASWLLSWPSR